MTPVPLRQSLSQFQKAPKPSLQATAELDVLLTRPRTDDLILTTAPRYLARNQAFTALVTTLVSLSRQNPKAARKALAASFSWMAAFDKPTRKDAARELLVELELALEEDDFDLFFIRFAELKFAAEALEL
jgi:hypothetical protein